MPCCLLLFDSSPVAGDVRSSHPNRWHVSLLDAPLAAPCVFALSVVCLPVSQLLLRQMALGGDMRHYRCCQGYFDNSCLVAGSVGDAGSEGCLLLESCCCVCCAISATRQLQMDTLAIAPDPCDQRFARCAAALVGASALCQLGGCLLPATAARCLPRCCAELLELGAQLGRLGTSPCTSAQSWAELARSNRGQVLALDWGAVSRAQDARQRLHELRLSGGAEEAGCCCMHGGQGVLAGRVGVHQHTPMDRGGDGGATPYRPMGDHGESEEQAARSSREQLLAARLRDKRPASANTFYVHASEAAEAHEKRAVNAEALRGKRIKLEDGRVARVLHANKRLGRPTTHQLLFDGPGPGGGGSGGGEGGPGQPPLPGNGGGIAAGLEGLGGSAAVLLRKEGRERGLAFRILPDGSTGGYQPAMALSLQRDPRLRAQLAGSAAADGSTSSRQREPQLHQQQGGGSSGGGGGDSAAAAAAAAAPGRAGEGGGTVQARMQMLMVKVPRSVSRKAALSVVPKKHGGGHGGHDGHGGKAKWAPRFVVFGHRGSVLQEFHVQEQAASAGQGQGAGGGSGGGSGSDKMGAGNIAALAETGTDVVRECAVRGANGLIDADGLPPHRISVRGRASVPGGSEPGDVEFACPDAESKQQWVQLLLCAAWQERAAGASEREHLPRVGRAPDDEAVLQRGATVVRMLRAAGSSREERRAKLAAANRGLLRACLSEAERFSLDDALRAVPSRLREGAAAGSNQGSSSSSSSSSGGSADVLKLLLMGADPDEAGGRETALFVAACDGNLELCRLLLCAGADANPRNAQGATALSWCEHNANNGWQEVAKLLRAHGGVTK